MSRSTVKNQFPDRDRQNARYQFIQKSHYATRIHQKLSTRLGHTLPAYSTITDWLRKLERGDYITQRAFGSGRLPGDRLDALIMSAFEQCPFHSVRTLYSALKHLHTIVWRHLDSPGLVVRNLRLVPCELSPSQGVERVGMAIELQQILQSAKHRRWWYFLTEDEFWLDYTIGHNHMWIPGGEEVLARPRRTIASPKRMLTVFWSPLGFSLVEIMPKGILFGFQYFCSNILSAVVQNRSSETH
jgi:hypothetical protein